MGVDPQVQPVGAENLDCVMPPILYIYIMLQVIPFSCVETK
jgi:hypothetical protein